MVGWRVGRGLLRVSRVSHSLLHA